MSRTDRVRIRFNSNINLVAEGTVDEILARAVDNKFIKLISLSDGMKEVFVNTELITVVEAV